MRPVLEEAVSARQHLFTLWTHDWLHKTCWVTVFNFPGWLRRSSQVHIIVFSVWFVLSLGLEFPSTLCMSGAPGYLEFSCRILTCQIKACTLWLDQFPRFESMQAKCIRWVRNADVRSDACELVQADNSSRADVHTTFHSLHTRLPNTPCPIWRSI